MKSPKLRFTWAVLTSAALLLCCALDFKQSIIGPFSAAFNVPADITGTVDTRQTTWGLAGSQSFPIVINALPGYRVRVLALSGNYMAWARGVYAAGQHVGTSWGITTTAPGGSQRIPNFAADNCFAYMEYGLSNGEINQPFSIDTHIGGLLGEDATLTFVSAVFLNDAPLPVHMETTFIMTYQFEKDQK